MKAEVVDMSSLWIEYFDEADSVDEADSGKPPDV